MERWVRRALLEARKFRKMFADMLIRYADLLLLAELDYIKKAAPVRGEICPPEMNEIEYCALREKSAVRKLAKVFARVISTLLSSESQRVGLGALSKN